ncbi:30S ribosomal protein S1 [Bacillus horti]|uniref:Small subunit ribosomal protein S1 n=1 Tax=Caldalkalibacillus horti TaxID=77523 RepID=A0ABT9W5W3_9BACI|nr:30S ribosomal protein S1 [Bacillus horti]MDQ0168515.1 small subunit ribosomal protein S1 [Bacillus horti]
MADEVQNEVEVQTYEVGDVVKATVTKVEDKHALVDFGYKIDGILPIGEISNVHIEKVADVISEGDELELKVIKVDEEDIVLSKKGIDNEKAYGDLEAKLNSKETFEVTIADVVKGGLVADVGVRAFIPASLVARHYVEDFSDYKGQTLKVKVEELDLEKNKVILSAKAVLDEEYEQSKKNRLSEIQVGEVLEGTVQRLTSFGVFVDIGDVDGLVHISELSWNRVESPTEVVNEGDKVQVKVLKVDADTGKISLSIKETQDSPWDKAISDIKAGDVVKGTVKRLVSFGAFVEIAPGVEGLVHISQIANRHIGTPGEVLKENQEVEAKVLDVDAAEKRISLSIRELLDDEVSKYAEEYKQDEQGGMGVTLGDMIGDQLKKLK